jgi:small-conductance mechanosensitive channel
LKKKGYGISVHYRRVRPARLGQFRKRLFALKQTTNALAFHWTRGHCVWELRPRARWDKGKALLKLWRRLGRPYVVAVGDDVTDEDMFRAVRGRGGRRQGGARRHGRGLPPPLPKRSSAASSTDDRSARNGGERNVRSARGENRSGEAHAMSRFFLPSPLPPLLVSAAIFVGGLTALWGLDRLVFRRAKRWVSQSTTPIDDFVVDSLHNALRPLLVYGTFFFSVNNLALSPFFEKSVAVIGKVLFSWVAVQTIARTVRFALGVWAKGKRDEGLERRLKGALPILMFFIWGTGALFLLDNLGFKITTVLAGLGVGGIAVALASQAVLGDLFGYLAILLDKPFEVGDFIIVNEFMGTVEYIGIKTTRLRSLGGEQLVLSNTDLTNSRVRNYKRMKLRRVVFKLGVVYHTSLETVTAIPGILRDIIQKTPDTRFDRAHFFSFDDSCLTFEIVYFVLSADYNRYMDVQQAINFEIKAQFEKRGIDFAFPTRTLHLHNAPADSNSTGAR